MKIIIIVTLLLPLVLDSLGILWELYIAITE